MCSIFLSGRASSNLTLDCLKRAGVVKPGDDHLPYTSAHCITVPGAAAAWCDTVEQFGSGEVLVIVMTYSVSLFTQKQAIRLLD